MIGMEMIMRINSISSEEMQFADGKREREMRMMIVLWVSLLQFLAH